MSDAERDAFLAEERTCRVATIGPDGPHATPLWFAWDSRALWLYSIMKSQRWTDLQRGLRTQRALLGLQRLEVALPGGQRGLGGDEVVHGPRLGVEIDAGVEYFELRGVEIVGRAEPVGELPRTGTPDDALTEVETIFGAKYMAANNGEIFHDRRHGWLRIVPTKITSWDFRKLADL